MTWPLECSSENSTLDDIDLIRYEKRIFMVSNFSDVNMHQLRFIQLVAC